MMAPPRQHQSGRRRPTAPPPGSVTSTAQAAGSRFAGGAGVDRGAGGSGSGAGRKRGAGDGSGARGGEGAPPLARPSGIQRSPEEEAAKRLIDAMFDRAVDIIQTLPKSGPIQTSYDDKLLLYSLFKQATEGDVRSARPGMLDILGRAKYDAWHKRKGLSEEDAKRLYVDSLIKILRKYRDDSQAVALIKELENFTADPRDLVRSGHSLSDARATGGRLRSSSSQGSSEEYLEEDNGSDVETSSVPPASLGPYVTRSQLPAPVEVQDPPSDRRSIPDSARVEHPSRRRARRHRDETEDETDDSSTESQPAVPPSRSVASRPYSYSQQGPMPLPPPPPHHPLYHPSVRGSAYPTGPPSRLGVAPPAAVYSGISTPAGAGTPLPPGGRFAPPPVPGMTNAPVTGPPSVVGAPWQAQRPPPSLPGAPPLSPIAAGAYPPQLSEYASALGAPAAVAARDPRTLEVALDAMQTRLAALQERLAQMEEQRARDRPASSVVTIAIFRSLRRLLRILGLDHASPPQSTGVAPEPPLTMGRVFIAVIAGFLGAARRLAVDAVVIGLLMGMFLRWRRGEAVIGWNELVRWMFGNARLVPGGAPARRVRDGSAS